MVDTIRQLCIKSYELKDYGGSFKIQQGKEYTTTIPSDALGTVTVYGDHWRPVPIPKEHFVSVEIRLHEEPAMTSTIDIVVRNNYKFGNRIVKVLETNRPDKTDYPIIVMDIKNGDFIWLATDGKDYLGNQLTELQPWDALKPGDLCVVRDKSISGYLRIFSHVKGGKPYICNSISGDTISWDSCRPLTEEEMAKVKKGFGNLGDNDARNTRSP